MPTKKRQSSSQRLTDTAIRAWLRTAGPEAKLDGSDVLHDGGGLYLRRRADGAFWALRQVNPVSGGRTWASVLPGIPYPQASLAEARRKAAEARLMASTAPTTIVQERRAALARTRAAAAEAESEALRRIPVRELFERWVQTDLTPRRNADGTRTGRKDGGEYVRQQFERRVFPAIGGLPAVAVTKADLMGILDTAKAEGRLRTANVLLTDLKQMFRFALEREYVERNPLDTVTRRKVGGVETQRDRALSAAELRTLAEAVPAANMSKRSAHAIWLILATGVRVGEAMGACWEHVDIVARTWHLPVTKNQREHTVHLSDFALRQFAALQELREVDAHGRPVPWVFPNSASTGPVCIKSFGKQLADRQRPPDRRMSHRSKRTAALLLPGGRWTAHDLRRTAATLMAELGISGDVIDECLNHVIESRVRRTYIRDRRLVEQARAFDALGKRLEALTQAGLQGNVVMLMRAA